MDLKEKGGDRGACMETRACTLEKKKIKKELPEEDKSPSDAGRKVSLWMGGIPHDGQNAN